MVLWLSDVWGSLQHEEDLLRNCADLLDAAGAVVDYQLLFGVSMEVAVVCGDGSVLQSLASRGELAEATARLGRQRRLRPSVSRARLALWRGRHFVLRTSFVSGIKSAKAIWRACAVL